MELTKKQIDSLFKTFVETIFRESAKNLKVPLEFLLIKYNSDDEVKETMNGIIKRHIDTLGK